MRHFRLWLFTLLMIGILPTANAAEPKAAKADGSGETPLWSVRNTDELLKAVAEMKRPGTGKIAKFADIVQGGGTITLAPGVYELDATLEFERINNVNLVGSGWNTILLRKGNGDAIRLVDCGFARVRNTKIVAEASSTFGSGIALVGTSSCAVLDMLRIRHFSQSGVRLEGTPEKQLSSNTVSNCHFIGNRQCQLYSRHNNDFHIVGNQFGTHTDKPHIGCWLDHSSAGTYTMNYHWDNVVGCKIGPGAHYNRIENNRFEESAESGVVLGEAGGDPNAYNIFIGNTLHSNSKNNSGKFSAMVAFAAMHVTFTSNQIFSWNPAKDLTKHCLEVGPGCSHWIIKDNIMHHNAQPPALVYDAKAGHIVKDNMTDRDATKRP